jgi:hypothetical protein
LGLRCSSSWHIQLIYSTWSKPLKYLHSFTISQQLQMAFGFIYSYSAIVSWLTIVHFKWFR